MMKLRDCETCAFLKSIFQLTRRVAVIVKEWNTEIDIFLEQIAISIAQFLLTWFRRVF